MNKYKINYIKTNWKLIFHLLFTTYKFGVNNKWWCDFKSIFGKPYRKRINPFIIYNNYRLMKFRAITCYFVQYPEKLFPKG